MNRALEYEAPERLSTSNFLFSSKYYLAWFIRGGRSCIGFFDRSTGALVASLSSPERERHPECLSPSMARRSILENPHSYSSRRHLLLHSFRREHVLTSKGSDDSIPPYLP